ncbi:UNVERIFIED_CONTAM: von Willebrand factor type A domain-containing protein [Hammondia hammondi]|eukprot:XP_008883059.1 von Willebrand factor type A domain-containing protein [Hammondia hammondi]
MNGWRLPLLTLLGQAAVISVAALTSSSAHQEIQQKLTYDDTFLHLSMVSMKLAAHEVTGLRQACKLKNVDAVVVLDSSMSVGAEHWQELLKLTKQFSDTLDTSAGHSRLGLVSYSDAVTVHRKLQKIPSGTAQFEEELGSVSFMNGNTFTPKALDSAYELFKETIHEESEGAEDQGRRRVLLLVTDGCADIYGKEHGTLEHHYRAAVGNLDKVPHLHTLVLGIGKHVCVEELRYIAGCDPQSLDAPCPSLLLTSWDSLPNDLRRLDKDMCEEITMEEKEDQELSPVVPEAPEISTTTCHKGRVDAVAVLDGSGSIRRADWRKTRDIAKLFSGALNIAEDQSHLSVVRFSTTARADWSLVQPVSWTEKQLTNRISRLPQPYGGTNTPAALEEAYKIFVASMNNRDEHNSEHVHRVLLLATDGCVNQWDRFKFRTPEAHLHDVLERMSRLKNLHIKVLGIGESICHSEIRLIAGCDPKGTESCRNAKFTDFNSVLDELPEYLEEICEEVEHGVLPPVSSPEDVTIPSGEPEGAPPAEEEEGGLHPPTGVDGEEGNPPTQELPEVHPPTTEEPGAEIPGAGPLPEEHPPTEAHPPTEEEGGQFEPSTEGECEREEYTPETQPPTTEEPEEETPGAGTPPEEHPPIEELPPTEEEGGELGPPPTEGEGAEEGFPPKEELPGEQPPMPEKSIRQLRSFRPLKRKAASSVLPQQKEKVRRKGFRQRGATRRAASNCPDGADVEEAPGRLSLPEEHPPIEELPPTEEEGGELGPPPTEGEGAEEGFPPTEELPGEQPPMPEVPEEEAPGAGPLPEEQLPPSEEGGFMPPSAGGAEETTPLPPAEESTPSETEPFPEIPEEEPEAAEKEEEGGAAMAAIAGGIIGGVLLLGAAGAGAYALLGGGGAAAAAAGSADAGEAVTQGEGTEDVEDREVGIDIDEDMFAVDEM